MLNLESLPSNRMHSIKILLEKNHLLNGFFSKKKKMNISQPIKQETKTESDLTVKRVEEDRGLATQVKFGERVCCIAFV